MRSSVKLFLAALVAVICLAMPSSAAKCPGGQTAISHRGDGRGLPDVYKKLTSCPNITTLELDMTMDGCVAYLDAWHFQFRDGDPFPNLTKLSLCDEPCDLRLGVY